MQSPSPTQDADEMARRLMREGLDDEAIAARTGLALIHLLALRAGAAVEEKGSRSPRR